MQPNLPEPQAPQNPLPPTNAPNNAGNVVSPQFPASAQEATPAHHPDYEFIMNPASVKQGGLSLGLGSSLAKRVIIAAAGLLVLLILFVVVKGVLGGSSSNAASLLGVVQDQHELLHIASEASQQAGISTTTLNSTSTITASISSQEGQLTSYIKSIGQKISTAQLGLKVSSTTDAQLTAAASAGTYDQTYQTVVQGALTSYQNDLKRAYAQTTGPRGRGLLTTDYNAAKLLVQQLTPTSP